MSNKIDDVVYLLGNLRDLVEDSKSDEFIGLRKEIEVSLNFALSHLEAAKKDSSQPTKVNELPRPLGK